jgi:endonuclease-3
VKSKTTSRKGARKLAVPPRRRAESLPARKERVTRIIEILRDDFPEAQTALRHRNPYELLVATILSAQCTDKRVNMVTPALFERYPEAAALANADPTELEIMIQSTGFFRNKARNLIACARGIVEKHAGHVPDTMEELTTLGGVGRKTANVVLGSAFRKNVGVVVDTHVNRISNKLRLTTSSDPIKVELDLMKVVPQDDWTEFAHLLILHGRAVCIARKPKCNACSIYDLCPGRRRDVSR